jgi:ligand-binding sensor domain-containing protein/two-component sensor histidine kinase
LERRGLQAQRFSWVPLAVLIVTVFSTATKLAAAEAGERPATTDGGLDYVVDFWRTEQGLPHNSVNAVLQGSNSYLWVGTGAGLIRFDGLTFTPLEDERFPELKNACITTLLEDRAGTLWVGTQGNGVFRLEKGRTARLTTADGLVDNAVTCLAEDVSGVVWIGTQRGLNRWRNGRLDTLTSDVLRAGEAVVTLNAGRSGTIWVTTRAEVYMMRGELVEPFRTGNVTHAGNPELRGAYEDRAGNLWTFSETFLLNLTQGKRYNAFRSLDPASSRVWSICEQDDGTFWIGTSGRGLVRFQAGRFNVVGTHEGLDQCDVRALFADDDGNLWVGTSGSGLARLRVRQWRVFTAADGLVSSRLTALAADPDGQLWIGTEDAGVVRFNGTSFESFIPSISFNQGIHIQSLCIDAEGAVWAGTWGQGLVRMLGSRAWRFGTGEGLSDDIVTAVAVEPGTDAVWAGTHAGGLHRVSDTNVFSLAAEDGLTGERVRCLLFTEPDSLIVGSERGGLVRWNGLRVTPVPAPQSLTAFSVRCLAQDAAGRLWVGTAGAGAFCSANGSWWRLTTSQGLLSDMIRQIVQDGSGHLWFSTDLGVFRVSMAEVEDFLAGRAETVTSVVTARGRGAGEGRANGWPSVLLTPGGALWIAGEGGLLRVDSVNLQSESSPHVLIERVLVDGFDLEPAEFSRADGPLELGPDVRSLDFAFTAIHFNAPERIRFRHKLEGFDTDWVQTEAARRAHYGPVPPGSYRFRVIAGTADGVWNEVGAAVSLVIRPPLWQAWWFLCLCGVGLVGAVWLAVRYISLRRLHAQLRASEQRHAIERERTRIARDMHDEIGSKLTRISYLSEVVRQGEEGSSENKDTVQAIADTSRELLQALDEIVWAVNPRTDNLEALAGYLEQYAREYFQRTEVDCAILMPPQLPAVHVSAEVRHNVFLAFEEALGNALKHASPSRVTIAVQVDDGTFQIRVTDNGCGFAAEDSFGAGRDGLSNMRLRLQAVGGTCETTSEAGVGTTVLLTCPLPSSAGVALSTLTSS